MKTKLVSILCLLLKQPGLRTNAIGERINIPTKSIERYVNIFKFRKFRKTDAEGFGCAAFHCFLNMIIRKDTTGIRDCPLGVPKMHSGASGFPLWSIGLSSMERWPMLHRAFTDHLCVVKSPSGDGGLLVVRLRIIISRNFN